MRCNPFTRTYRLRSLVALVFLSAIGMGTLRVQRGWAANVKISRYHAQMKAVKLADASSLEAELKEEEAQRLVRRRYDLIGPCSFRAGHFKLLPETIKRLKDEAAAHTQQELDYMSRW